MKKLLDSKFGQVVAVVGAIAGVIMPVADVGGHLLGAFNAPTTNALHTLTLHVDELAAKFDLMPRPHDFAKYEIAIAQNSADIGTIKNELTRVATIVDLLHAGSSPDAATRRTR